MFKLYAIHNRNKDVFPTEKDSTPTPKCYSPIPLFVAKVITTKIAKLSYMKKIEKLSSYFACGKFAEFKSYLRNKIFLQTI